MQMHSASETKAAFVGSQRPPPQSPSSFLWIGTLTFPTVMRPADNSIASAPRDSLSPISIACLLTPRPRPPPPVSSASPLPPGAAQRMDSYSIRASIRADEATHLGTAQRKRSVAAEQCEVHIGGLEQIPGWGFRQKLNHNECQFSLGRLLRDRRLNIHRGDNVWTFPVCGCSVFTGRSYMLMDVKQRIARMSFSRKKTSNSFFTSN